MLVEYIGLYSVMMHLAILALPKTLFSKAALNKGKSP